MFPSGISKLRLLILIVFCLLVWKTLHYFAQLKSVQLDNEVPAEVQNESHAAKAKLVKPIEVTVYYEALCSDSRNFILKQLVPTYEKLFEIIDIDFVPYGKATTVEKDGTYAFECQHSFIECDANKVHACVLDQPFTKKVHLKYVACMIQDNMVPHDAGHRCAEKLGLDYDPIRECANGLRGSKLLAEYGVRTHAVSPKITFIPTIQLNHSNQVPLVSLLKDLAKEICHSFHDHDTRPKQCL